MKFCHQSENLAEDNDNKRHMYIFAEISYLL